MDTWDFTGGSAEFHTRMAPLTISSYSNIGNEYYFKQQNSPKSSFTISFSSRPAVDLEQTQKAENDQPLATISEPLWTDEALQNFFYHDNNLFSPGVIIEPLTEVINATGGDSFGQKDNSLMTRLVHASDTDCPSTSISENEGSIKVTRDILSPGSKENYCDMNGIAQNGFQMEPDCDDIFKETFVPSLNLFSSNDNNSKMDTSSSENLAKKRGNEVDVSSHKLNVFNRKKANEVGTTQRLKRSISHQLAADEHMDVGLNIVPVISKMVGGTRGNTVIKSILNHSIPLAKSKIARISRKEGTRHSTYPAISKSTTNSSSLASHSHVKNETENNQTQLDLLRFRALDDHRYTLKSKPNSPVRQSNNLRSNLSKLPANNGNLQKPLMRSPVLQDSGTSILELFLRSNKRVNPNLGSDAALASEGIIPRQNVKVQVESPKEKVVSGKSKLLHKLLTNQDGHQKIKPKQEVTVDLLDDSSNSLNSLPVDSLLIDGFGLDQDLCLDDPQRNGIGLLGNFVLESDSSWKNFELDDWEMNSEFSDIIQEEERQSQLLNEYYTALIN